MTEKGGPGGAGNSERPVRRVGVSRRTEEFCPDHLTPEQATEAIVGELVEWLYVFDPDDRQIARFRGTNDGVDLSDKLKARSGALGLYGESVLKDHLIVHNHPTRSDAGTVVVFPPSWADLETAIERDLRCLVVVSGPSRFVIRRPGPFWPLDEAMLVTTIDDLTTEIELGAHSPTTLLLVEWQLRILETLRDMEVIDYEHQRASRV